jgi:hypothetical protein
VASVATAASVIAASVIAASVIATFATATSTPRRHQRPGDINGLTIQGTSPVRNKSLGSPQAAVFGNRIP